ncbi:MAG: tetratricopeptide repeat protein [Planctomycetes bacterium]|nr:tetratricopeptide repeat protein [Planctomycetota bacterium]
MSEHDDAGEALEREFEDVLATLHAFTPAPPPADLEERIAMTLKKDAAPAAPQVVAALPGVSLRCTFCHDGLPREEASFCAGCLAPHHDDCFGRHGRCAAPGCGEVRLVRPRAADQRLSRRRPRALLAAASVLVAGLVGAAAARIAWEPVPVAAPPFDPVRAFEEYKRLDQEAMAAFRALVMAERAGNAPLAQVKRAEAHAKWTRAIDILNRILDDHREPHGTVNPAYEGYEEEMGRVAQVLVDLEKRAQGGPAQERDPLVRARERLAAGDLAGARTDLDRALALDPMRVEAYVLRAEVSARSDDLRAALDDLHRAIELDPGRTDVLLLRSRLRFDLGDLDGSLADAERALVLDPLEAGANLQRARVRLARGEREAARADLERALQLAPRVGAAWSLLGWVRLGAGEADGARANADRAIDLAPDDVVPWLVRARASEALGDLRQAAADLERALMHPEPAEALARRAQAWLALGDVDAARADAAAALELDARNVTARGILREFGPLPR